LPLVTPTRVEGLYGTIDIDMGRRLDLGLAA
jgi:hypothetical protein